MIRRAIALALALASAGLGAEAPAPILDHQAILDAQTFWDNRDFASASPA